MAQAAHLIIDMQGHFLRALGQERSRRLCAEIDNFVQGTAQQLHHLYVRTAAESDWYDTAEERAEKKLAIPVRASLTEAANACFSKKGSSALRAEPYAETDLACYLRHLDVKTVYLSGLYRSLCVWQSALDAKNVRPDLDVFILDDLTGEHPSIDSGKADPALFPRVTADMAQRYGIGFLYSRDMKP